MLCSLFFVAAVLAAVGAAGARTDGFPAVTTRRLPKPSLLGIRKYCAVGDGTYGQWTGNRIFCCVADQADLSRATTCKPSPRRGYVYNALLNKSQTTQGPILQWLRDHRPGASLLLHR